MTRDATDDIIRFPMRIWPMALGGIAMALVTIPFALVAVWRVWSFITFQNAWGLHVSDLAILLGLAMCGGMAVFALGIAINRPVGLRLDGHGISGYLTPAVSWSEIDHVEGRKVHKGQGLVVTLNDRDAILARHSGARRRWYAFKTRHNRLFVNTTHLYLPLDRICADVERMRA